MPDFSAKPTLTGGLVTLRPVSGADAATLRTLMSDPEVGRLTGSVHSSNEPEGDAYSLEHLAGIYERWSVATDRIVWVIIENSTGRVVGESVLNDLDEPNLCCGFRIWIAGATGRGLGTEAVRLTVAHAFATGLHRVELEVYAFNPRARRVYEKVGFVLEGTRRQALRFDDEWVDCHVMGLLAGEWRG
jgi:RimJ/RimL family protein N-acetyltransferase